MPPRCWVGLIAGLSLFAASNSRAVPIFISNHSFEDIVVPDGYYTVNNVPGWLGEASWHHILNPTDAQFAGTTDGGSGPNPIDGRNAAAVNNYGRLLYQNLTTTILPNYTYTLSALVGHRFNVPFDDGSINLIAGDRFLARGFADPVEGGFTRLTVVYNSASASDLIGQQLRIELRSAGTIAQAWFDDIQLDAAPSLLGITPTLDSAYVPLPMPHPDYLARKDLNWGVFTPFGGGPLDSPAASVPDTGTTLTLLLLATASLLAIHRGTRMPRTRLQELK